MTTQSKMSPEWQRSEAAGLRAEALRLYGATFTDEVERRAHERADRYVAQADLLERAYLSEGECLEDGRGPLTPEERTEMDAVPVGLLP